ncbi:AraC family transcriptional regulator [Pseudomonas corrugata]|uniref:AraC family transcriptional regulator n=1 Tax=Pseudomonas corrugata TaxID=47879 RepID=A0A7Y6DGX0_9PSED|nr:MULTISPECIES: AraC family transcriptional regulator [Pseudomonas]MCI0997341.1 AraC family transcriptional regulator [Pseudomonas corrugata]NUT64871.1 AraC family transcriptional regulator [Pseudomonas corrugata]NUT87430.1 AraC family transcriptional regulator [Pseudomonas corrugata]TNF84012.1 AraC family transcriptional regulator [Pseudomonas sp. ICMP22404]
MTSRNWIDLKQDATSGIETVRAHFEGHAYDPHWHDAYLVGVTEEGVQQFHCRRQQHNSTPGKVFLLEPGELHDGHAPQVGGFTYRTLYLEPHWLERELRSLFDVAPDNAQLGFAATLADDARLANATALAFQSLHDQEIRIVRQTALDTLLANLTQHLHWRARINPDPRLPLVAQQARDYLHSHLNEDIGLDDLARVTGVDRFRLTRAFKAAFGLAPHAYLIQLRLARARRLLARGESAVAVAAQLGFADQSHLGRWFQRAYRLSPADYRKRCSIVPD